MKRYKAPIWMTESIKDLTEYKWLLLSLKSLPEQIEALECQMEALKSTTVNATPVQGGTSRYEDNLLNCIVKKSQLEARLRATKLRVAAIERGIAALDEKERKALDRFYIDRPQQGHIEQLENELHLEQAQVYRIKDQALYKFTLAMYGLTDY